MSIIKKCSKKLLREITKELLREITNSHMTNKKL